MTQKSSILGGALLLTASNLLLRLISIGFNVFLTERIGAAGLGLLQLISTVGVFAILAGTGGIRIASMCLAAEEFGHRRLGGVRLAVSTCLRGGLLISSLTGVILFFAADPIADILLQDIRAAASLRVMGLTLPFSCLCGIMTGYFTACSRIRRLVATEIAERLLSVLLTAVLLLTWAGNDLSRACLAITLGSSLGTVFDFFLLYFMYRRDMRHTPAKGSRSDMDRRLLRLCVPIALNDLLRAGLNSAEQLLIPFGLARFSGSSEAAMASYGTIHAMVFPIMMFPAAILYSVSDLLVPELSRSRAMGRRLRIADLSEKCLRLTTVFASGVAGLLFLNAYPLGRTFYGSEEAGYFLRCFAPVVIMLYLDAITDGMLKGLAEQVSCVRINTLTSLLDVIFLFVLLPRWGISGYLFSFVVTHAVNLFLSLRRLLRSSDCRPGVRDLLLPPVCALLALLPTSALASHTVLKSAVFLLLLSALYLLFQALSPYDFRWILRVFRRSIDRKPRSE